MAVRQQAATRANYKCNITKGLIQAECSNLNEIDGMEIYSLVDNTADFISSTNRKEALSFRNWTRKKYGEKWVKKHTELPLAEHGFSIFLKIFHGEKITKILFDTGNGSETVTINAKRMGLDFGDVKYVALSHGHYDHIGGLISALDQMEKAKLIIHEHMFRERGVKNKDGTIRRYPYFIKKEELDNVELIMNKKPLFLVNETFFITGEIPRKTHFETGYSTHQSLLNDSWIPDPLILDDRAIAFKIKRKGLVIISGCAHAGIINTILNVQEVTGESKIQAVIGGFHLAGKENEKRISQTVKELKKFSPDLIVPSHCTGWRGIKAIADALPQAFTWNSVGNQYKL